MMKTKDIATERGAALVLALLVMLVLSSMALVALRSVSDTSSVSGMHRLQVQAKSVSNAVNSLGVMRSGQRAASVNAVLQGDGLAEDHGYQSGVSALGDEYGRLRRGGFIVFSNQPEPGELQLSGHEDEELLLDGGGFDSVEAYFDDHPGRSINYDYIVRDPVMGPRAEGFGDEFCFVIVTIGSKSQLVGRQTQEEERIRQMQSLARNAARTMIGPIECG